jgi:gliding motility-associated-like protein
VKKVLLILCLLLGLHATAQVAPPQLRCLEVLTNGDVKFTWIPPTDPNNQFFAYEIYAANAFGGPYTMSAQITGPLSTNTFVLPNAGANISSRYYYLLSTSGLNGSIRSQPGDTLRTMFLNVQLISGAKDLKLLYYNLRTPPLPSTLNTYTLQKEYPMGSWNFLGSTALTSYADTISVCSASINYQVRLADKIGCYSSSNVIGDVYLDSKDPNEPLVDSVSVLPNGNTIIAWRVPYDKDVVNYEIQYKTAAGPNATLAVVPGRNNTSFTYSSSATATAPLGLFVGAIDSCKRSSTLNYNLSSLFVKAQYDSCAYSTTLSWNEYRSMPNGILEYRVYYSQNGSPYALVGSTSGLGFTHSGVSPDKNICYFVRAVNKTKTITASSNRVCFFSTQVPVPAYLYLSTATVLNPSTIRINWLVDTSKTFSGLDLFRSTDNQNFSPLAYLPYTGARQYSYTDESVQSNRRSYYYRARLRDACGNARNNSNTAKTILLQVSNDRNLLFTKHLSWSAYEGFGGGVRSYALYRIVNQVLQVPAIATTPSYVLQYTDNVEDLAGAGSDLAYVVIASEAGNNGYGPNDESSANTCPVYEEGTVFVPTAFAPNGMNPLWLPVTHFVDKNDYRVQVYNRWGNLVFETNSDAQAWDGNNAPGDVYAYLITFKNARGEYRELKGSLLLMR